MNKETLKKGTRIYYNGDMANEEGRGTITKQVTDKSGDYVYIKMDDGRDINRLPVMAFSDKYLGHGGTRFVTEEAYKLFRQEAVDRITEELEERKGYSGNEIDDALVPKYAIQPLRTAVLVRFARGEIDVKELARKELESRGLDENGHRL